MQLCTQKAEAMAVSTVMTNWMTADHFDLFMFILLMMK